MRYSILETTAKVIYVKYYNSFPIYLDLKKSYTKFNSVFYHSYKIKTVHMHLSFWPHELSFYSIDWFHIRKDF